MRRSPVGLVLHSSPLIWRELLLASRATAPGALAGTCHQWQAWASETGGLLAADCFWLARKSAYAAWCALLLAARSLRSGRRRLRSAMAVVAAGALPLEGSFAIVKSAVAEEYEEFFIAARIDNADLLVLSTTAERPDRLDYFIVEGRAAALEQGGFRLMVGLDAARAAPLGVDRGTVNLVCTGELLQPWEPDAAQAAAALTEGHGMAAIIRERRQAGGPDTHALPRIPLRPAAGRGFLPQAPQLGGLAAGGAPGPVVQQAAPMPAPGLGLGLGHGFGAQPGAEGSALELAELRAALQELKQSSKKKKKKKKGTKKRSKKKDSASSSSSSTSRSSSGSSSGPRYLVWEAGKKRKFTSSMHSRMHALQVKRRADLLTHSHKRPGMLAAWFLQQVRSRMLMGEAKDTDELKATDCTLWAAMHTGLKEPRDIKEAQLLAKIITELGAARYAHAADLLCQRVRELLLAKKEGSSWDKASVVSLMPGSQSSGAAIADGAFHL